jgi:hypothetical protein
MIPSLGNPGTSFTYSSFKEDWHWNLNMKATNDSIPYKVTKLEISANNYTAEIELIDTGNGQSRKYNFEVKETARGGKFTIFGNDA